jgi:hypothetical protein
MTESRWTGDWVLDRLDITLESRDEQALRGLVGLALRRNPRRAHLLVSTVLGKHVPVTPGAMRAAGRQLGARVDSVLGGPAVVVGMAETATALGHLVADELESPYLHTTRRAVVVRDELGTFEEEHSHATTHRLLPEKVSILDPDRTLVLVDDEISTGLTSLNFMAQAQRAVPRRRFVLAALVDVRTAGDRARFDGVASNLGLDVDVVSVVSGEVVVGPDVLRSAAELVGKEEGVQDEVRRSRPGTMVRHRARWPAGIPEGGRHGFLPEHRGPFELAVAGLARDLALSPEAQRIHVLGHEELMYLPMRLAEAIEELRTGLHVTVSSTSRSPVHAVDHPSYPIRDAMSFPAHDAPDDGPGPRFAYNIGGDWAVDELVLVVDERAATPELDVDGGLVHQLRRRVPRVHLVVVPNYLPEE